MFEFHYDTDKLLYYIKTDYLYLDMYNNRQKQDQVEFSNYPKNHLLYNNDRKKVPGLFQDECVQDVEFKKVKFRPKFVVMIEYVGLSAKSCVNQMIAPEDSEITDKQNRKVLHQFI
mgnify:CR=1 FL=1